MIHWNQIHTGDNMACPKTYKSRDSEPDGCDFGDDLAGWCGDEDGHFDWPFCEYTAEEVLVPTRSHILARDKVNRLIMVNTATKNARRIKAFGGR